MGPVVAGDLDRSASQAVLDSWTNSGTPDPATGGGGKWFGDRDVDGFGDGCWVRFLKTLKGSPKGPCTDSVEARER